MFHDPSSNAAIHPSIDGLSALILSPSKRSADETTKLHALCVRKLRSYREDVYITRYTTTADQEAARARWQIVAQFANTKTTPKR